MNHSAGGAQPSPIQERSTAELVKELSKQISVLVRDGLKLAQLEMTRSGKRAGIGIGMLGGGLVKAVIGRGTAEGTRKLTGGWPGKDDQQAEKAA